MSQTTTTLESKPAMNSRPIQILPYTEKTPDWYIQNGEFYITKSQLFTLPGTGTAKNARDLSVLYNVYNNKFPLDWFTHITDPLSAKKEQHKAFPAKIRPVTILRTNIDLLLGEYPRRPFIYNVENLGESGYNSYVDGMKKEAEQALTEHFIQAALQEMQAQGQELNDEAIQKLQQDPPVPEQVKADFKASFKDLLAIKGQRWLRRIIREAEVRRKLHKCFKDWLIAGEVVTYKSIENGQLVYRRLNPMQYWEIKSAAEDYGEDGEASVYVDWLTLSDVVDRYYEDLSRENHESLERKYQYASPTAFYNRLSTIYTDQGNAGKIPVYHVVWKGRKEVGFLSYLDPSTWKMVEEEVDENYVAAEGEQIDWKYVNEVYEVTRIGDDIYTRMKALQVQRNELNNISKCRLPYNSRKYSDTQSENISVLEVGIPFQILYIIVNYILEKTIAKSKGKILLIDKNTMPDGNGWDEEKSFYYAEALGYMLLDRNQIGVDKTWNQYQVVDMSLFDNIKQLIELKDSIKQEWDDIIGITRQRKGQTYSSDGQGVNERSVFQSTVITDMIFLGMEEFAERELQGIMDLGKYLTSNGVYGLWNDDEVGKELLEIMPEDFQNEQMGVFIERSAELIEKMQKMQSYAQAMLQNDHKASTVLEIIDSINIAELKAKLRRIEEIDMQIQQAQADDEHQKELAMEEIKKEYLEYQNLLDIKKLNADWDRKDENEMIKGAFNTMTFQDGDSNDNGVPDATEIEKLRQNKWKMLADNEHKKIKNDQEQQKIDLKGADLIHKIQDAKEKNKLTAQSNKTAAKKAAQRPKSSTSKKK